MKFVVAAITKDKASTLKNTVFGPFDEWETALTWLENRPDRLTDYHICQYIEITPKEETK